MSDDYAKATASPRSVTIDGKEYLVGKFGPLEIGDLGAWLKDKVPNPRSLVKELIEGVPESVALQIWRDLNEEAKSWPPTFDSEAGQKLILNDFEGHVRLLWVTLRKHNKVDLAEARRLAGTLDGFDILTEIIAKASPETASDPKSTAETKRTPM